MYSPDGQRIVAVRSPARNFREQVGGGATDLVWVPANGGATTLIAPSGGLSTPHFTQGLDADLRLRRRRGLVSMRWDGTDVKTHLRVTGGGAPGGGGGGGGGASTGA